MELTWISHTDLAAVTRGRAVPNYSKDRLHSVGWVPANLAIDAFRELVDNPWGPIGDLRLVPDPETLVRIGETTASSAMSFVLSTATDLEGNVWKSCPRAILLAQTARLRDRFGLQILSSFEHEFAHVTDTRPEAPFSLEAARAVEPMLNDIVAALQVSGVEPETILSEYGRHQFEVTSRPALGVTAADRAVITRTVVREIARRNGIRVTFAPVIGVDAGTSGVHIHFSLVDMACQPVTHDSGGECGLSPVARSFAAGIVDHLPALTALTAPSTVSYLRLQPHSWSAAYAIFGKQNREAALRVAPISRVDGDHDSERANLEYRPADATANPYLSLAAILIAGMDGLTRNMSCPQSIEYDPSSLSDVELDRRGIVRLPQSLEEALDCLEKDLLLMETLDSDLMQCYLTMKRNEVSKFSQLEDAEMIARHVDAY